MSLVICSNRENDRPTDSESSIYEPWSFRNGLSSTYTIPKDAQVGLHSCKINLDGTMTLSGNEVFYQYFGRLLDPDDDEEIELSSSQPIATPLSDIQYKAGRSGRFEDYDAEGVAGLVKQQMNDFIFHPNLKDKADCDVKRDNTTNEFTGYDFTYDQYADESTTTIPKVAQAWTLNPADVKSITSGNPQGSRSEYPGGIYNGSDPAVIGLNPTLPWKYEVTGGEGVFTSVRRANKDAPFSTEMNAMINTALPLSLYNGQMTVDISDVNDADQNWVVGLSRFCPDLGQAQARSFAPANYDSTRGTDAIDELFCDFQVRRYNGLLYVQHLATNQDPTFDATTGSDSTFVKDLDYWTIPGATLTSQYDLAGNATSFEKVRFTAKGQTLKIEMIDDRDAAVVIYSFDESQSKALQLPPIHQACWCLHPVLAMETDATKSDGVMLIQVFEGCKDIVNYGWSGDDTSKRSGSFTDMGWFEYVWYEDGMQEQVELLEERYWLDQNDTASGPFSNGQLRYASVPSSGNHRRIGYVAGTDGTGAKVAGFSEVLIPGVTKIYPSPSANMTAKLGFNQPYDESFTHVGAGATSLGVKFTSDSVPVFKSGQSIFVRVSNLTQRSMNAFKGSNSQIIAHLPRFDGQAETGRLYYEPSEIMWLDLDNAQELKTSSFDLSFVYVNEQFVKAMTGQSIVCLAFRKKPKEM